MPEEVSWESVVPSTKFVPEPLAFGDLRALIADVQDDQWSGRIPKDAVSADDRMSSKGTTDFDGATERRADLFSRLRCPTSIKGGKPNQSK